MKSAVVIERGPTSLGAQGPDLPGWVAVGETRAEFGAAGCGDLVGYWPLSQMSMWEPSALECTACDVPARLKTSL